MTSSISRRRILVTGSSGKLGSSLAMALSANHDVIQLDVREPADPDQRAIGRVIVGSVTDRGVVAEAMEGADSVVHCAAIPSNRAPYDALLHNNVGGTVNLLEESGARKKVQQFVFISTIRVHGVLEAVREEFMPRFLPFNETHPYLTVEYYGGGKLQAEHWCEMYVRRFRKPLVVFRPSFILAQKEEPGFESRPEPGRPDLVQYVATSDFVCAIALALDYHPTDGIDRFLVHGAEQWSTTPTLDLVKRHFPGVPVDASKLAASDGFAPLVDCARVRDALGWEPMYRCKRAKGRRVQYNAKGFRSAPE